MKLFAALLAAASSATLGGSFLGAPQLGLNVDASIPDSGSAMDLAGSSLGGLNMLAPSGDVSGSASLNGAVSSFQHRASIIDDMYDASGTAWLQLRGGAQQSVGTASQPSALGMESPMASANIAFPWQTSVQQQQQLPELQPPPAQPLRMQQFTQMQQSPQMVAPAEQVPQSQPLPPFPQMQQTGRLGLLQQSATSFITEPLGGEMQPPPSVNADQLFRDASLPEQRIVREPLASQLQGQQQVPVGGTSLLSLLGQGQGQGFGPTDPPRESPWISMSDPTREPPVQQQFLQTNPNMLPYGQTGSFGQQQMGMMPFGSGQMQGSINLMSVGQSQMNFQPAQMNPDMMMGNPSMMAQQSMMAQPQQNMMALQEQPQPGSPGTTGCILCQSRAAQEAPNENKWAEYFSKGSDDKRKHDEAFE